MSTGIRHSGVSLKLVAARAAVAVGLSGFLLATGAPALAWQLLALLVAMLTTGLLHGSVDQLVAQKLFRAEGLRFYVPYLAVGGLTALLWMLSGPLALAVFLALSVWHFGEGDLRDHVPHLRHRTFASITRGLIVVGTLFTAWPEEVASLLGAGIWDVPDMQRSFWVPVTLCAVHIATVAGSCRQWRGSLEVAAIDAIGLATWLWCAPPILAFAGYFAAWHSLAHIDTLQKRLVGRSLLYHALPLTLVATAGAGLALVAVSHWMTDQPVAAVVLPVLAALASPHILMVEAWRWRDPADLAPGPLAPESSGRGPEHVL